MKVSVVLPTYNEAGNIVRLVTLILQHIPADCDPEVIVVDDNSPDGTYAAAEESFGRDPRVKLVLRTQDRGFAKSIRAGITIASGDKVVVMDTDLTHDPAEIPKMLKVSMAYDIVSGSRFCAGGRMQDTKHYLASLAFNFYIRVLLRTQIQDNLGGYFVARPEQIKQLPLDRIFFGYGEYYFRLLFFAQKAGMSVVEVPAVYHIRTYGESKSNFFKMVFTYTRALLALRRDGKRQLPG